MLGDVGDYNQLFLVTDYKILFEIRRIGIVPVVLLAAYFGFNIKYPIGCNNFYTFMEVFFLGHASANKVPPSVKHMLSSLSV